MTHPERTLVDARELLERVKLCECGCGQPTKPYKETDRRVGNVKGEYARYVRYHKGRRNKPSEVLTCLVCGETKPLAKFAKDPRQLTGRRRRCRVCDNERMDRNAKTAKGEARRLLRAAVNRGEIAKPNRCESCGEKRPRRQIHGHHHDYRKPLDVSWLCIPCHVQAHADMRAAA